MDNDFYALQYIQQDIAINQHLIVTNFVETRVKNNFQSLQLFPFPRILRNQKKTLLKNFTTEITLSYTQHSSRVVQGRDYPEEIFQKKERLSCFQFTLCYLLVSTLNSLISVQFFLFFLRTFSQLLALLIRTSKFIFLGENYHLHDYQNLHVYSFFGETPTYMIIRNSTLIREFRLVRVQLSSAAGRLCSAVAAGKQPQPTHNFSQTQTSFCAVSYCCLCPTDCLPACQISQPVQPRPDSAELAQWTLRM